MASGTHKYSESEVMLANSDVSPSPRDIPPTPWTHSFYGCKTVPVGPHCPPKYDLSHNRFDRYKLPKIYHQPNYPFPQIDLVLFPPKSLQIITHVHSDPGACPHPNNGYCIVRFETIKGIYRHHDSPVPANLPPYFYGCLAYHMILPSSSTPRDPCELDSLFQRISPPGKRINQYSCVIQKSNPKK